MRSILVFIFLVFISALSAQVKNTGFPHYEDVPSSPPPFLQFSSEVRYDISRQQLFFWDRGDLDWKPMGVDTTILATRSYSDAGDDTVRGELVDSLAALSIPSVAVDANVLAKGDGAGGLTNSLLKSNNTVVTSTGEAFGYELFGNKGIIVSGTQVGYMAIETDISPGGTAYIIVEIEAYRNVNQTSTATPVTWKIGFLRSSNSLISLPNSYVIGNPLGINSEQVNIARRLSDNSFVIILGDASSVWTGWSVFVRSIRSSSSALSTNEGLRLNYSVTTDLSAYSSLAIAGNRNISVKAPTIIDARAPAGDLGIGLKITNTQSGLSNTRAGLSIRPSFAPANDVSPDGFVIEGIRNTGLRINTKSASTTGDFAEPTMTFGLNGNVGIGDYGNNTSQPAFALEILGTNAVKFPVGTTAQRPTGVLGVLRSNSTTSGLDFHDGTAWRRAAYYTDATPSDGQQIVYSTAEGAFVPTSYTPNQILYSNASGTVSTDAGLTYKNGNVGVGTTPNAEYRLNVSGNTFLSGTTYFGSPAARIVPNGTEIFIYSGRDIVFNNPRGNAVFVNNIALRTNNINWNLGNRFLKFNTTGTGFVQFQTESPTVFQSEVGTGNVGIGTAAPAAKLEVRSTNSGILIPRLSEAQRTAIVAPLVSELIFNVDANEFQYWDGALWTGLAGTFNGTLSYKETEVSLSGTITDLVLAPNINTVILTDNTNAGSLSVNGIQNIGVNNQITFVNKKGSNVTFPTGVGAAGNQISGNGNVIIGPDEAVTFRYSLIFNDWIAISKF